MDGAGAARTRNPPRLPELFPHVKNFTDGTDAARARNRPDVRNFSPCEEFSWMGRPSPNQVPTPTAGTFSPSEEFSWMGQSPPGPGACPDQEPAGIRPAPAYQDFSPCEEFLYGGSSLLLRIGLLSDGEPKFPPGIERELSMPHEIILKKTKKLRVWSGSKPFSEYHRKDTSQRP